MELSILNQITNSVSGTKPETRSSSEEASAEDEFSQLLNQALSQPEQASSPSENNMGEAASNTAPDQPPTEPSMEMIGLPNQQAISLEVQVTPAPAQYGSDTSADTDPEAGTSSETPPASSEPVRNPAGKAMPDQARATFEAVQKLQQNQSPDKPKTLPEQARAILSQLAQGPQKALQHVQAAFQQAVQQVSPEQPVAAEVVTQADVPELQTASSDAAEEIVSETLPVETTTELTDATETTAIESNVSPAPEQSVLPNVSEPPNSQPPAHAVAAALGSEHAKALPTQASARAQEVTTSVGHPASAHREMPTQPTAPQGQAHGQSEDRQPQGKAFGIQHAAPQKAQPAESDWTVNTQPGVQSQDFQRTLAQAQTETQPAAFNVQAIPEPAEQARPFSDPQFFTTHPSQAESTAVSDLPEQALDNGQEPAAAILGGAPKSGEKAEASHPFTASLPAGAKVDLKTDGTSVRPATKPHASQPAPKFEMPAIEQDTDISITTTGSEPVMPSDVGRPESVTIPLKGAEQNAKTANLQTALFQSSAEGIGDQVVEGVSHAYRGGQRELTIQLNPHNLGEVRVHIVSRGEQGVVARMIASSTESHEALQSQISQLKTSLEAQGINIERLSVVMAGRSESADTGNSQQSQTSNGQGNAFGQQRQESGQQSNHQQQQAFQEALFNQGQHNGQGFKHSLYAQPPGLTQNGTQSQGLEGQAPAGWDNAAWHEERAAHDNGNISILA